jgi:hypothetical protein
MKIKNLIKYIKCEVTERKLKNERIAEILEEDFDKFKNIELRIEVIKNHVNIEFALIEFFALYCNIQRISDEYASEFIEKATSNIF